MSVKVASNRLIVPSVTKSAAFYQHILSDISDYQKLGDRLIQEACRAQAFRHADRIEELAVLLSNIPIKEYRLIGQYYIGWSGYLRGERPRKVFEEVLERSQRYKAKALISLAVIEAHRGDYTSELAYYNEALKYADNPSSKIDILRGIAAVKAKEGFNKQSLRDLERMWPLVRYGDLKVYHDYLNSYAVELLEAGRIQEASNISRIVLASPYAFAYPEWRDTGQEIAVRGYRSRAQVSVAIEPFAEKQQPKKLLHWPERDTKQYARNPFQDRATLIVMSAWKKKMGKKGNGDPKDNDKDRSDYSDKELVLKVMEVVAKRNFSRGKILEILDYLETTPDDPPKDSD